MKSVVKKFRKFLDTDFEVKLPGQNAKLKPQQPIATKPGYVNPFKHQQELQQKQAQVKQTPTPPKPPEPSVVAQQPINIIKPIHHAPTPLPKVAPMPKKPSLFDKKLEITIQKPNFKKPTFKKPDFLKPKPKPITVKEPFETKPLAPQVTHIPMTPKPLEVKPVEPPIPPPLMKKPEIKLPEVKFRKPEIALPKLPKIKTSFKPKRQHGIAFTVVVLGLIAFGTFAFTGFKLPTQTKQPTTETAQAEQESVPPATKLAEAVGKKIDLPKGEEPESATISDITKLKDQEFFKEARNGDKILMYKQSKKAYLYRPAIDEVIAVAPLVFQDVAGASTGVEEPEPTIDPSAPKTSIMPEPPHGKVLVPARY